MSAVPREIDRSTETHVHIRWEDGHETSYTARDLRLICPCASCVDEITGRRRLDPATVPEDVRSKSISLVGRYAVDFDFSDGHGTGIYSFGFLREHCPCDVCRGAESG